MIHGCEITTAKVSHSDSFRSTSSESKLSSSSSSQEIPTASLSTEQLCGSGSSSPAGTIRPPVPPRRKRAPAPPKAESEKEDKGAGVMGGMRRNDLGEVDGCEDTRIALETGKLKEEESLQDKATVERSAVETSAEERSSGEKSPAQASPVQRSPVQKSPVRETPIPAVRSTVERYRVEKSPVEKSPVEEPPGEKSPMQTSPVQKSPTNRSPPQKSPLEESPVQKPAAEKPLLEKSPLVEKIPVQKSPVEKPPGEMSPEKTSPVQKSPVEKSPAQISPVEKSPSQISPVEKSPAQISPLEKSPVQKSPTEKTADFNSLDETSADIKSNPSSSGIRSFDSSSSFKSAVGDLGEAFKADVEKVQSSSAKKLAKFSVGSEGTVSSAADAERCESEISAESPRGEEEEDDEIEIDDEEDEEQEEEGGCEDAGEWKGVYVRGRRKGSYSSDIEAWKRGLTGWCSVEEEDEFLESTMFDPEDSQSLSVGCGSPLIDAEKSMEEWYSSNDAEGRVYFFEENSNESSWTLPEVSVTSPSQTPPPAGISGSPMGSDSFISGKSSGGEEGPGPNDHGDAEKEERSGFSLKGEPPMPKVKLMQSQWEKASGGRLIQLRDPANMDMDGRGPRNSRSAKTRSMVVVDSAAGEMKIPSTGKQTSTKDWPQLWEGNMCVLREGTLNRTKITENGKRLRKNWAPSYVVLTELQLLFFKDAKSFAAMKAGIGVNTSTESAAIPELSVDLNGALVERDDRLSSRRNVFRVSTVLGLQVLCQDDNPQTFNAWFQDISKAAHHLPSGFDGSPRQNTLERQSFLDPHSPDEHKKLPRIGRSKSVKMKKDASMEDLSAASVTERQVKIRARLKKFFHRRPTMESLVKKGIWKDEPSFGCYLEQVSGEGIPRIPLFVQRCISAIEAKPENMRADGLYRASGNLSQVQKIRLQVDQYNYEILDIEEDVHVLTGALKLFFRELKEPLIPFSLFNRALTASTNPNRKEQLNEFKELVKTLPLANYDTLKYLLKHLLRVTKYQESNRMHIANLAIVFGPTLMWPEQESLNMALDLMQQNLVIECLLQEFDTIFSSGR